MNKAKEVLRVLFPPKQQKVSKEVEVPTLGLHPRLLEYLENGWAERVNEDNGEPKIIDGRWFYQIIDMEEGLRRSRLVEVQNVFELASKIGISKEMTRNARNLRREMIKQAKNIADKQERDNLLDNVLGIESSEEYATEIGLDSELVYQVTALCFCFQNEDPRLFDGKNFQKRVKILRDNDLDFFFYTHSFKILSIPLKIFMEDTPNFIKTHVIPLEGLLPESLELNTVKLLNTYGESISNETYSTLSNAREMYKRLRIWNRSILLSITTGSFPLEK